MSTVASFFAWADSHPFSAICSWKAGDVLWLIFKYATQRQGKESVTSDQ